ncbi:MAG: hypothetical protein H8M99_10325 [Gloeobacteraceae cyanobacterium ES-bin-144]|nr:hypothetical protein [Verrucomicrobiales bacterium]
MKTLLHGLLPFILAQSLFAEISNKQLEGYWKFLLKDEGIVISSVSSYLPNGQYTDEGSVVMTMGDKEQKLSYGIIGRWELVEDNLVITVSESTAPQLYPKGMIIKSKITKITEKQMTFISELDKKEYIATRTVNPNTKEGK